jgi:hypothetical protein
MALSIKESFRSLFNRKTAVLLGIVLIGFALTLHFMGRIPMCECGFGLVTLSAWSSATSQNLVDPYSFSHVLHGIIFFGILFLVARRMSLPWKLIIAVLIEVAWEIFENTPFIINRYREATASLDYFGDSILNSMGDVLCTILGFWIASRLSWKWTLALVVVIELVMLYAIRDNLTLNILMLLYPIDAIKEWQVAG